MLNIWNGESKKNILKIAFYISLPNNWQWISDLISFKEQIIESLNWYLILCFVRDNIFVQIFVEQFLFKIFLFGLLKFKEENQNLQSKWKQNYQKLQVNMIGFLFAFKFGI